MGDGEQLLVLTRWGVKWVKFVWNYYMEDSSAEKFAKRVLADFDSVTDDPIDYVDAHVYESVHTITNKVTGTQEVGRVERKKKVLQKGRRSLFAASIAKLAYNKFGERPMSEANVLVTRKWIQKLLEEPEYKDLRTCDKNLAIDRALFLSFVKTQSFRAMRLALTTKAWEDRNKDDGVFGKVFRLVRGGVPRQDEAILRLE
jgi:hypothetical protein